jgi:ABC-type branched-subunit amino acid transport system substrate-binding protein
LIKKSLAISAAAVAVSLTLAGCATGPDTQNVKTDFGVTASTITLGIFSDFTGPFKSQSPSLTAGNKIYFNDRNANNKICGRTVEIVEADHGMNNQTATTAFQALEPKILSLTQFLGTAIQEGQRTNIANAGVTALLAGWSSTALVSDAIPANKYYVLNGTTYPLDIINGLSYFQDEKKINKGDNIGYLYIAGLGDDAFKGGTYFAEQNGYTLLSKKLAGTETDLSAQIAEFKSKGITALVVSGTPAQVGPAIAAVKGAGMTIPVLTNSPGYVASSVAASAPTAAFVQSNLYVASSVLPFDSEGDVSKKVAAAFTAGVKAGTFKSDVVTDQNVNSGYAMASVLGQVLDAACKSGDLTRAGVNAAISTLSKVVTGVTPDLDYTNRSKSPSTATYILKPDANAVSKSTLLKNVGTSATAAKYQAK